MNIKKIIKKDKKRDIHRHSFLKKISAFKKLISNNNYAEDEIKKIQYMKNDLTFHPLKELKESYDFLSEKVLNMIESLEIIAPDKYPELMEEYRNIRKETDKALKKKIDKDEKTIVIPLERAALFSPDKSGIRLFSLSRIKMELNIDIPHGFVISSDCFNEFMTSHKIKEGLKELTEEITYSENNSDSLFLKIDKIIKDKKIPEYIQKEIIRIEESLIKKNRAKKIIMKTSELLLNSKGASYPGQVNPEISISFNEIEDGYKKLIAQRFYSQALRYREVNALIENNHYPAVGCFEKKDYKFKGIVYTRKPEDFNENLIRIFPSSKNQQLLKNKEDSESCISLSKGHHISVVYKSIDLQNTDNCPHDDLLKKLAENAVKIENIFNFPQRIEWGIDYRDKIFILDVSPLAFTGPSLEKTPVPLPVPKIKGGIPISSGGSHGRIFNTEIQKKSEFRKNSILLVKKPFWYWSDLLARSSGLIIEKKGSASMLSDLARELQIPAIMDLKNASKILLRDEVITIDADKGYVYSGRINEISQKKGINFSGIQIMDEYAEKAIFNSVSDSINTNESASYSNMNFKDIKEFIMEKVMLEFTPSIPEKNYSQLKN